MTETRVKLGWRVRAGSVEGTVTEATDIFFRLAPDDENQPTTLVRIGMAHYEVLDRSGELDGERVASVGSVRQEGFPDPDAAPADAIEAIERLERRRAYPHTEPEWAMA